MEADLSWIAQATGATSARISERIQSLWGGYGEIFRVSLTGAKVESAIVKCVSPPADRSLASHLRKCRSYDVETCWYRTFAPRCDGACRVPALIDSRVGKDRWLFVLEDLDAAGFALRHHDPDGAALEACLAWLAAFHARFLGVLPDGLWKSGTYWHLATRPGELAAIEDDALRRAAPVLDRRLRECTFRTLVHGDAKPDNFCFSKGGYEVAAVDFQYVGGGCGMKDVAYFLSGAALHGSDAERRHLDIYFRHLRAALGRREGSVDADALEREWRALYPIACADFYRFLAGWAKASWRRDGHAQAFVRDVLRTLS